MEKKFVAIVKLKTRINGHKATITEDYQNLKELLLLNAGRRCYISGFWKNRNIRMFVSMKTGRIAISNIQVGLKINEN